MNKKGFTLIELLAVIVILAIIAVITSPIIIGVIEGARKDAAKDKAWGTIHAVDLAYAQDQIQERKYKLGTPVDFSNKQALVGSVEVKASGELPTKGTVTIRKDGSIIAQRLKFGNYTCSTIKSETDWTIDPNNIECLKSEVNIKNESRVIQNWGSEPTTDFHNISYRTNIINVTFLDTSFVPSNAIESWDVSRAKDKGVMAYVTANEIDNTKYDLFIGANNGVIANSDSAYLFRNFNLLENINFNGNFDTSNVISMFDMFAGYNHLTALDLSDFDTRKVRTMGAMFTAWTFDQKWNPDRRLTSIIFGENFDTSNVTNMRDMFAGFMGTSLDLKNFNTSNVTNMFHMFNGCNNLTGLNLCSFDTRKVTNSEYMFGQTKKLNNVYVGPNWTIEPTTENNLFNGSNISQVTTDMCDQIIN